MGRCLGGGLLSLSLLALFGTLKFLNALFLGFLRLSLRAVFAKTAWQSINLALFLLFGLPRSLCSLARTADFVILSLCKKATQRVARRKPQQKNPKNLRYALFMDTSLALSMTASASLRAVFAKTAWQSINLALFLLFGLPRSLCSLAMTAKQKFKFFIQNSRHFINSIHFINSNHLINSKRFINLSQISSHTQGFFIFLPQIFEQFLLINLVERRSYGNKKTEK